MPQPKSISYRTSLQRFRREVKENRSSDQPTLFEADEDAVADDDVVEGVNAHDLPRADQPLGDGHVLPARRGVAGGVVVGDDQDIALSLKDGRGDQRLDVCQMGYQCRALLRV